MLKYRTSPSLVLAALVAAATVTVATPKGVSLSPAKAQSAPSFTMPDTVPQGTQLKISSSSAEMAALSAALKHGFEGQFAGSKVAVEQAEAKAALQSLIQGQADLAAISRPLTADEKAQGLVEVPVKRVKIALVVGTDNAFKGSLSSTQFADIFRGKITDWSAVGGPAGPIRLIDRPNTEVRLSLASYPVFQSAPFQTGSTATQLSDASPTALVNALGKDGISYAPMTEIQGLAGVRTLALHQTPPTDARYPFSRPFSFVYKGQPSPAVAAFLGYATSPVGQTEMTKVDLTNPAAAVATGAENAAGETNNPIQAEAEAPGTSPEITTDPSSNAANLTETDVAGASESGPEDGSETGTDAMGNARGGMADALGRQILTVFQPGRRGWLLLPVALLGLLLWAVTRTRKREANSGGVAAETADDLFGDIAIAEDTDDEVPFELDFDHLDTDSSPTVPVVPIPEQPDRDPAPLAEGLAAADETSVQATAPQDMDRWSLLTMSGRGRLYGMPEDANGTVQVGVEPQAINSLDTHQEAWPQEINPGKDLGPYGIRGMTDRIMGTPSEQANSAKVQATDGKDQANQTKQSP